MVMGKSPSIEIQRQSLSEITIQRHPAAVAAGSRSHFRSFRNEPPHRRQASPCHPRLPIRAASLELRARSQSLVGAAEDGYGGKR